MELLHGPRTARKILLLQESQSEVLVLTSASLLETWSKEVQEELKSCAQRGVKVQIHVENSRLGHSLTTAPLRQAGVKIRSSSKKLSWMFRPFPVQGEIWIFDRIELSATNERMGFLPSQPSPAMAMECLLGPEAARGTAAYFDRRWETASSSPLAYSVRHKDYTFHSGHQAEREFFTCLHSARQEITLSLPGGRLSRRVAEALMDALGEKIKVTIFANAERDDGPGLKRLRRLAGAGAVVKICGRRLRSECAVVDGACVYMGSLPSSWNLWAKGFCPIFVMQDGPFSQEILAALESQVSIEINGEPSSSFYAYR